MGVNPQENFTQLLERHRNGDAVVRDQLLSSIYAELRRLAAYYMSNERGNHTLQPTAVVHEAWIRLAADVATAKNKAHFMALAAQVMKEVLCDHARKYRALKRGGDSKNLVSFDDSMDFASGGGEELLELCDSIDRLRELDERQARLVELRVFGGMSFEEAAEALDVSLATVKRDWLLARAWLYREFT